AGVRTIGGREGCLRASRRETMPQASANPPSQLVSGTAATAIAATAVRQPSGASSAACTAESAIIRSVMEETWGPSPYPISASIRRPSRGLPMSRTMDGIRKAEGDIRLYTHPAMKPFHGDPVSRQTSQKSATGPRVYIVAVTTWWAWAADVPVSWATAATVQCNSGGYAFSNGMPLYQRGNHCMSVQ